MPQMLSNKRRKRATPTDTAVDSPICALCGFDAIRDWQRATRWFTLSRSRTLTFRGRLRRFTVHLFWKQRLSLHQILCTKSVIVFYSDDHVDCQHCSTHPSEDHVPYGSYSISPPSLLQFHTFSLEKPWIKGAKLLVPLRLRIRIWFWNSRFGCFCFFCFFICFSFSWFGCWCLLFFFGCCCFIASYPHFKPTQS